MRTSLHFRLSLVLFLALGLFTNLAAQDGKTKTKVECIKKEKHSHYNNQSNSWESSSVDEPISYAQSFVFHNDYNGSKESQAFFGIYPAQGQDGVLLTDVSRGAGAEAAGMRAGDVIINMAGQTIATRSDFTRVLNSHQPGDKVQVLFVREGQVKETSVLLSSTADRSSYTKERDPCKVFIGINVSHTSYNDQGVRVSGIISNTPAAESRVQGGDIITALDNINVYTFNELLAERNKHKAGDYFTLSILRDGVPMEINARFKVCDEPKEEPEMVEVPMAPIVPVAPEVLPIPETEAPIVMEQSPSIEDVSSPTIQLNNTLPVVEWSVFPNPAVSRVQLNFRAEALPTIIQLIDVTGKVIYREQINKFDGIYKQEINIEDAVPGSVFLQVIQGDLIKTEKIIVLDRG